MNGHNRGNFFICSSLLRKNINLSYYFALFSVFIGVASVDAYTNSVLLLQKEFGVSYHLIRFSFVVTPLISFVLGPFYSILASKYKITVIWSLCFSLLLIGFMFASIADTFNFFIFSRILQASGSAGITVSSFCYILNCPNPGTSRILSALFTVLMPLSWCFSPLFGGFITSQFGWRYIFVSLFIVGALVFIVFLFSNTTEESPSTPFSYENFSSFFYKKYYFVFSLCYALPLGFFCFQVMVNPTLINKISEVSTLYMGVIQSFFALCLIISASIYATSFKHIVRSLFIYRACITFSVFFIAGLICSPFINYKINFFIFNILISSMIGFIAYPSLLEMSCLQHKDLRFEFSAFINLMRNICITVIVVTLSYFFDASSESFYLITFSAILAFLTLFLSLGIKNHERHLRS